MFTLSNPARTSGAVPVWRACNRCDRLFPAVLGEMLLCAECSCSDDPMSTAQVAAERSAAAADPAEVLWRAVRGSSGSYVRDDVLVVVDPSPREVAVLLPFLAGVQTEEWTGGSGCRYRDYFGRLPCGLLVRLVTDRGLPVDLPGGDR